MSTTPHATTEVESETETETVTDRAQLREQTVAEEDLGGRHDLDEVSLPHLECPIDGTLISRENQLGTSATRYECPHCKGVWKACEVLRER